MASNSWANLQTWHLSPPVAAIGRTFAHRHCYYYSTMRLILIYRPSEGGRLSRPMHYSQCAAHAQSCASQWFSWKHRNFCHQRDLNLGSLAQQASMLPLDHCDLLSGVACRVLLFRFIELCFRVLLKLGFWRSSNLNLNVATISPHSNPSDIQWHFLPDLNLGSR